MFLASFLKASHVRFRLSLLWWAVHNSFGELYTQKQALELAVHTTYCKDP